MGWFSLVLEDVKKRRKIWQKIEVEEVVFCMIHE